MGSTILSFDIETIPQQTPLSSAQQEEFDRCFENTVRRKHPSLTYNEALEILTPAEKDDIKTLVMSVTPFLGEVVCIGLVTLAGELEKSKSLIGSEKDMLKEFWGLIANRELLFVSFNGISFDVPFIVKRSMFHGIPITNRNFINLKRFSRFPHFDVKLQMNDFDKYAGGKLTLICDYLGIPSPKDGEIKADQVYTAFKEGKQQQIGEYCLRDVKATLDVYKILADYVY